MSSRGGKGYFETKARQKPKAATPGSWPCIGGLFRPLRPPPLVAGRNSFRGGGGRGAGPKTPAGTRRQRRWANLKALHDFSVAGLLAQPPQNLAELIRPAGYYNLKERRLRNLLAMLAHECEGDLDALFRLPLEKAREKLLAVTGGGPGNRRVHPVVCRRSAHIRGGRLHHAHPKAAPPGGAQGGLPRSAKAVYQLPAQRPALFNEFHACLVGLGHRFCKPRNPLCQNCPALGWAEGPELAEPVFQGPRAGLHPESTEKP